LDEVTVGYVLKSSNSATCYFRRYSCWLYALFTNLCRDANASTAQIAPRQ
jgi:hypothetical protein